MIMISSTLEHNIVDSIRDENGRFLLVKCEIEGEKLFLINVYGPNVEREHEAFMRELYEKITAFYDDDYRYVVSEGDWNFTDNLTIDRAGGNPKLWPKDTTPEAATLL